jgi:hypothetical protein
MQASHFEKFRASLLGGVGLTVGPVGKGNRRITFTGACITWPILYTALAKGGLTRDAFKDAVTKMNRITKHEFVYRRWHEGKYRRHPSRKQS